MLLALNSSALGFLYRFFLAHVMSFASKLDKEKVPTEALLRSSRSYQLYVEFIVSIWGQRAPFKQQTS